MKTIPIIFYIGIIIWSTIPYRHIGKRYFYFFYSYALADPLTLYLRILFHSPSNFFYIPVNFIAFVSLFNSQFIKKNKLFILITFIIVLIININISSSVYLIIVSLLNFLILIKIVYEFIFSINLERLTNIFLIVMILNTIATIFQFLGIITGFVNGYFYYYAFVIFQIFIGIFFWIFKEDNPKLNIRFNIEWNDL